MKELIFTKAEMKKLDQRLKGNKEDSDGLYASRVKPKVLEMLRVWFPIRKTLLRMVRK